MNKNGKASVLAVVILAIFSDMLMYGLVVPFLPVHAESLGASQSQIGILFSSYALALFVATPFFGALSDKVGRKKLLVWGLIALAVTTLLYAFASSFWVLVLARLLQGFAAAIPWTAGLALLAEVFPKEERGKAMGLAMSGQAGGVLLGPPIGGWLYDLGGYRFPFFTATGIALILAILCLVALRNVTEKKSDRFTSPFKILRNKNVLIIAGVAVIGASVFASIEPTLPIHFNENLEISAGVIGLLFVAVTLGYGLTSPLIGSISTKIGHVKTIRIGIIMAVIVLPLNALPTFIWLQVVTLALLGITLGMVLTPALPKLADISQEAGAASQGLIYAVYNTAYSFGMMAGPVIASILTDGIGLILAYSAMGALFIVYLFPLAKLKS